MKFLVVAGDKRQEYLCEKIKQSGNECVWLNEKDGEMTDYTISDFSVVVLPVPLSRDGVNLFFEEERFVCGIDEFLNCINKQQHIICFGMPEKYCRYLDRKNIKYTDLMKNNDFIEYNSLLTAQGTIRLILENTQRYILGNKVLVTGYGSVSKALCKTLHSLGLNVTVCARNPIALSDAKNMGYDCVTFDRMDVKINDYNLIFGTVPANVLKEDCIKNINDEAIYFELASAPYGAERVLFDKHNKKYVFGGGLPGKYCPESWAQAVSEYCTSLILCKEENL